MAGRASKSRLANRTVRWWLAIKATSSRLAEKLPGGSQQAMLPNSRLADWNPCGGK